MHKAAMQAFSLGYPTGRAGLAVLLLRVSLGLTFAAASIQFDPDHRLCAVIFAILSTLAVLGLAVRATMLAAIAASFCTTFSASPWVAVPAALAAAGVALLGAGAYSLDSVMFGRRVFVINRRNERR